MPELLAHEHALKKLLRESVRGLRDADIAGDCRAADFFRCTLHHLPKIAAHWAPHVTMFVLASELREHVLDLVANVESAPHAKKVSAYLGLVTTVTDATERSQRYLPPSATLAEPEVDLNLLSVRKHLTDIEACLSSDDPGQLQEVSLHCSLLTRACAQTLHSAETIYNRAQNQPALA